MLAPDYPIETARLKLRPVDADADPDAMAAYQSRADVCRYIPYEPRDRDRIVEVIRERGRTTLTDEGQQLWLSVLRRDTGRLIGDVLLFWHSRQHRGGEIGYVFDPEHQGQGYATEAAAALLDLGFDGLGLHRIVARVDARNEASARVLRRLGMRQEAYLVQNEWFKGEWSDEIDFAILDDEWRALRQR